MSDFERDPGVTNLLTTAGDEALRFVRPEGVGAVVSTVRHRRRTQAVTLVAAAVVLLGGPATAVALTSGHHGTGPAGPPTASTSASASDSPSAVPSPSNSPTPPVPNNGRISLDQLRNDVITVLDWPKGDDMCPTGQVKFSGGKAGQGGVERIQGSPVYVDVDHDGVDETVILLSCNPQWADYQVIVIHEDASLAVETLGRVVASGPGMGTDIMTIWGIAAGDNGQVRVDVGEFRPCCEEAQASQHQWRTYGWNGTAFTQTGGPTAFGPNPLVTTLATTPAPLTMVKQADGSYTGTLHVTVRNKAQFKTPGQLWFELQIPASTWAVQPVAGSVCQPSVAGECKIPALAAGASLTLDVKVTAPAGGNQGELTVYSKAGASEGGFYPDSQARILSAVQVTWS